MVLSALVSIPVQAKRVSETTARRIADIFMETDHTTRTVSSSLELVWNGLDNVSTKTGISGEIEKAAPFYVFNRQNGGFVIVAGDDREQPILAYSDKNSFSSKDMPDNVRAWTESMILHMEDVIGGKAAGSGNAAQWQEISSITKALGGTQKVLTTAQWDQGSPFSNYCTEKYGSDVLTGCSATAAAILMRYHKYPSQAYGPIPGYNSNGKLLEANTPDENGYDWDNMPLTLTDSWTEEQEAQVARLMYDCGTAFKAQYGSDGTSAQDVNILKGMTTYMKFNKNARLLDRADFSWDEWLVMLKNEIDSNTPVIYTGQTSSNSGHAFIIDGYDTNGYLHVNWGWGGINNGFYAMTDIEYSVSDNAMIGLVPENSWTTDLNATLSVINNFGSFTTDIPYIQKNVSFNTACAIWNEGQAAYDGTLYLKLFSKNGTVKQTLDTKSLDLGISGVQTVCTSESMITVDIADGDYLAWTYTTPYGEVEIRNNRFCRIPLRYSLANVIGLSYNRVSKEITLDGLSGMTCSFQGADYTFPFNTSSNGNSLEITASGDSGTFPLVISNGNETVTVNITF